MGILNTILGRREPPVQYRTVDGGHPAPYPDMTDEQLYNYEIAFNVPNKTFDKPPSSMSKGRSETKQPEHPKGVSKRRGTVREEPILHEPLEEPQAHEERDASEENEEPAPFDPPRSSARTLRDGVQAAEGSHALSNPAPLDLTKPVRTVTTKQPVEIITTRARHPVYKVHGYIGDDNVVTVFTLDGQLSENGPRFLENIPENQQLYLNIYMNPDPHGKERYILTQHESRQEADQAATSGRIACVPVQFDE